MTPEYAHEFENKMPQKGCKVQAEGCRLQDPIPSRPIRNLQLATCDSLAGREDRYGIADLHLSRAPHFGQNSLAVVQHQLP